MNHKLIFDFTIEKSTNSVFIKREFAAPHSLVWDAFTKKEILDQWWAPQPWISKTKYMNFEVGGKRFYAMCSPEGEEHWSIQTYISILPKINFQQRNAFSDKDENENINMPSSEWNLDFSQKDDITTVVISIKHQSISDLEKMLEMGFQGGFTMTLNYLDQLIDSLRN